jgi:hypothetical protein
MSEVDELYVMARRVLLDALEALGTDTDGLATRYARLLADNRSMSAASVGRGLLKAQFATRNGPGIEMAIRSAGALVDANEITESCLALAGDLLTALDG